jgi:hypothetical protein
MCELRLANLSLTPFDQANKVSEDHFEAYGQFLLGKSNAYGDQPIRRWGAMGVIIRIDSKVLRYINLIGNPDTPQGDEPTADTLRDIVGYAVLGYRLVTKA